MDNAIATPSCCCCCKTAEKQGLKNAAKPTIGGQPNSALIFATTAPRFDWQGRARKLRRSPTGCSLLIDYGPDACKKLITNRYSRLIVVSAVSVHASVQDRLPWPKQGAQSLKDPHSGLLHPCPHCPTLCPLHLHTSGNVCSGIVNKCPKTVGPGEEAPILHQASAWHRVWFLHEIVGA